MQRRWLLAAGVLATAAAAHLVRAEVIVACTFPTLPSAVMRFPDGVDATKTMEVGARPPVSVTEGQGAGRLITAEVDGYTFRFAPSNSVMDVEADGAILMSEEGRCATTGGPVNEAPLQIAGAAPVPAATPPAGAAPAGGTGRWVVSEDKSAFDDSRTVVLSVESDDDIRGQFGPPGPASLYLRCMENTTVVYLVLNDLFLSDIQGFGKVEYRIDDGKAASVSMAASTDNKALGLWSGGSSIPFIEKLIRGERVVFRATPFNESPVEFTVDLTGLETAVVPLREACSW
ncbi:type VI secretion system-associated protein TagO [Albidovulum sp.]|uniref:type VI secretion system-associated protein TagO n=1 Tax=Albidovulum sp. TaxID=1872424 RepID=UPI0039B9048B